MSISIRKRYIKSSTESKQKNRKTIDCEKQQENDYKFYHNNEAIMKEYKDNIETEKNQKHFNYFNLKTNKVIQRQINNNNNNLLFNKPNKINAHKVNFTEVDYIYEKPETTTKQNKNIYNQNKNYRNSSSEIRIKLKNQQNLENLKNILTTIINHEFQKLKPNMLKLLINHQDINIFFNKIYKKIEKLLNEYNANNKNEDFIHIDIVSDKNIINEVFVSFKSEILNELNVINKIFQNYFASDNKLYNTDTYKLNNLKMLKNFRKHCNKCNDVACHSCKCPLYIIPNSNYIVCKYDKEIYDKNNIVCFCEFDNEIYLSSFLPEGYRNNMLPLTNRNSLEDEMITCNKCKHTIFFNIRENIIKCIKCNNDKFDENNDVFYNESFYGKLKDEINFALLIKKKTINNKKCYCGGIYYKGEFLGKNILVCSKCKKCIYENNNENNFNNKRFKYDRYIINDEQEKIKNINNNNFWSQNLSPSSIQKNSSFSNLNRETNNNKNSFEHKNIEILNTISVKPVPEMKSVYYRRKYQNFSTQENNESQAPKEFESSKTSSYNKSYVNRRSYYNRNKVNPINLINNIENKVSSVDNNKNYLLKSKTNDKKIFSFYSQKNNKYNKENETINIENKRDDNEKIYNKNSLCKASELKRENSFDEINKQILNKMLTNSLTERNFKSLLKNIDPNLIKELNENDVLNNIKEFKNNKKNLNSEVKENKKIAYDVKTLVCNMSLYNRQKHLITKYTPNRNNKSNNNANNINNIVVRTKMNENNIKQENNEKNFTIPSNLNMNDYNIICLIGSRCFSNIYKVQNNKTKKKYAVKKIIIEGEIKLTKRKNEILLIQQLSSGYFFDNINIIPVIQYNIKKLDITAYAMYELMPLAETDWDRKIFREKEIYNEEKLVKIMQQLVKALSFMQKDNICHRDIKPSNILIMNDNYYLGDFEESIKVDTNTKNLIMEIKGTEAFLSPLLFEALIKNQKKVLHNVYKSDVFSLGLCFVCALTKNLKVLDFIKLNKESWKIKKMIMKNFDKRCTVSNKFIDLIMKMLAFEEKERYDFIELNEIINNWR